MKIVIIGYSGSGKSTLAENLARYYSIPKLHMDTLQFQPGWIDSDRDTMEGEMRQFLSDHKDWVIDGNYLGVAMRREWSKPTRLSFSTSLVGTASIEGGNDSAVIKVGSVSMAAGCPERFDWEFIRWILWDGRCQDRSHAIGPSAKPIQTNFISPKPKRTGYVSKKHIKKVGISNPNLFLFINVTRHR